MPSRPPSTSSQADLRIESERRGSTLVVKLIGSANMDVSMGIRDRIIALMDEHTHQIVIELSRLDFISSVGLGEIISAHIRCCRHGIELKLAGPKPAISVLAIDAPPISEAINQLVPSARAKVSMRIAPGQDPRAALDALVTHLEAAVPWGAEISITPGALGEACNLQHVTFNRAGAPSPRHLYSFQPTEYRAYDTHILK